MSRHPCWPCRTCCPSSCPTPGRCARSTISMPHRIARHLAAAVNARFAGYRKYCHVPPRRCVKPSQMTGASKSWPTACPFGTARSSRLTPRSSPRSHVRASPTRGLMLSRGALSPQQRGASDMARTPSSSVPGGAAWSSLPWKRVGPAPPGPPPSCHHPSAPPTGGSDRLGGTMGGAPGRCGPARVRIFLARAAPCR